MLPITTTCHQFSTVSGIKQFSVPGWLAPFLHSLFHHVPLCGVVLTKNVAVMALYFTCIISFNYSIPVDETEGLRGLELQCHITSVERGEGVVGLFYDRWSVPCLCFSELDTGTCLLNLLVTTSQTFQVLIPVKMSCFLVQQREYGE